MKTMSDKVFGEISYNLFWEGKTTINWNGKDCSATIIIRSANEQPPSDKQQNCYSYFKNNSSTIMANIAEKLLAYCQDNYEKALTVAAIYEKLMPKEIIFRKTGRWGVTFDSPWEDEKRLAVAFKDDVATAGTDDLLI